MSKASAHRSAKVIAATFGAGASVIVGQLVAVDTEGVPLVDYPGNELGPLVARVVGMVAPAQAVPGAALALAFDNGDRGAPLILGVVSERLPAGPQAAREPAREVIVNGETVQVQADKELTLQCGRSSILLRRDGKIVIKGVDVVSRASGANKIKGGLVNIN